MSLSSNQLRQIILSSNANTSQITTNVLLGSIQDKENEKTIILVVNNLLSNNKTRSKGLEVIRTLILHCSSDVVMENITFWINNCVVNQNGEDPAREIKLRAMEKIIKRIATIDSFHKKFVQEYLADIVKACLTYQSNKEKVTCLKCLLQCMEKYGSSLNNFREKIEITLSKFLESLSNSEVKDAAVAFHYWCQTGSAGVNGINYVNNFRNNFKKLCATVHNLYDNLFENIHEMNSFEEIDSEVFKLSGLQPNTDSQKCFEINACRIINCLIFMETMIAKRFPVEKQITPKYVIDVIVRGLSVHVCLAEGNILLSQQVYLLKEIQLKLFQLLRTFIIGYCSSVLPFINTVIKCILNAIKRVNNCQCFSSDSVYKMFAYKSLISLMPKVEDYSLLQEALIPLLLEDIRPCKRKLLLKPNLKKQGCTLNHLDNVISKCTYDAIHSSVKEEICVVGLEVLKCFLAECPITVIHAPLKEVMSCVVRILTGSHINKVDPSYTNTICQIKLYEVLISFFKQECENIELPIHLVASLLHKGTRSHIYKVAQTSREGLELIEKISHPLCSSLCIGGSKLQICHDLIEGDFRKNNQDNDTRPSENREINVLSNILITDLMEENCGESRVVTNVTEETVDEVVVEIMNDLSDGKVVTNAPVTLHEEIKEKEANIREEILIDGAEISECFNEPPKKKQKQDENDALEDMFESFRDVVQKN